MTEYNYTEFLGTVFLFKHNESGNEIQAYTPNGVAWMVKTGNMIPNRNQELEEQEIVVPWEKFIERYTPNSEEAKEFIVACLDAIIAAYQLKIEGIVDWIDDLD